MRWALLMLLIIATGCSPFRSRYAMDDPAYAEKYERGASRGDLIGKAKQWIDARHTDGLDGFYFAGGTQVRPSSGEVLGGAELGFVDHPANWATLRGALGTYQGQEEGFAGVDLGMRLQTPSRLAPFVGLGVFGGGSRGVEVADFDGRDNDDDGFIDEIGEQESEIDGWLSAVYPEAGVHFWLNGKWRISAFGRYLISSQGRDHDDWLLGGQLTLFRRGPTAK